MLTVDVYDKTANLIELPVINDHIATRFNEGTSNAISLN